MNKPKADASSPSRRDATFSKAGGIYSRHPDVKSKAGGIISRHPLDAGPDPIVEEEDDDGPDIAEDDPDLELESKRIVEDSRDSSDGRDTRVVEMPAWKKFLFSYWGAALCLTVLSILLLLFIRPAFLLKRRQNTLEKPKINWLAVFITMLVLFAAYAGIPALIQFCKKKWVSKAT